MVAAAYQAGKSGCREDGRHDGHGRDALRNRTSRLNLIDAFHKFLLVFVLPTSLSIDTARRIHTMADSLTAQVDWTAPDALGNGVS